MYLTFENHFRTGSLSFCAHNQPTLKKNSKTQNKKCFFFVTICSLLALDISTIPHVANISKTRSFFQSNSKYLNFVSYN